ncbi:MAG: DUF1287 domain-containing protein [Acidobacteria bacterium]|nr:DUF1287 domain-containing protein [Acidobacteriota bacterium]
MTVARQVEADRYYAVHVLGVLKDPRAVDILLPLLDDAQLKDKVRWALDEIGGARAVPQAVARQASTQTLSRTPTIAGRLVAAAVAQTRTSVTYDGSYRRIPYPGGDVPATIGVCTDVVIRAYRQVGVDLQVKVHEDMARAFRSYPQAWGMSGPDSNIDHRRVPNLQTFFRRAGAALPISRDPAEYHAGDLVTWVLPGNLPHIGIVTSERSSSGTPLIVHNIGRGPQVEDVLFKFTITGRYRY